MTEQELDEWRKLRDKMQNSGMSTRVLHAFMRGVEREPKFYDDAIRYSVRKTATYYQKLQAQATATRHCLLHLADFNEWALQVANGEYDEFIESLRNFGPKSVAEFKAVMAKIADPSASYYAMYI